MYHVNLKEGVVGAQWHVLLWERTGSGEGLSSSSSCLHLDT